MDKSVITVDTCGLLCPQPLIKTRQALKAAKAGERMVVVSDNETAFGNLQSYLKELKIETDVSVEGTIRKIGFTVPETVDAGVRAEDHCSVPARGGYVVVIRSERMGSGDEQLGAILMRAYLNALPQTESLPSAVILYNGGVKLALRGSDTAEALAVLEGKGVPVYACGTCLDFYGVKEQLAVGTVSNMYKIAELTAKAGHVVYP